VLCGNNLSSFSLLPPVLAQLPPALLSAAAWIWQQVRSAGLRRGLFIPGEGGPPSPRRSPTTTVPADGAVGVLSSWATQSVGE